MIDKIPVLSIIMPCLNAVKHISEAIDSVIAQTFTDFELLIVDSGSTDGTLEVLSEYANKDRRVLILKSSKKSMGAQYNIGLDAARGDYVGFVESDDYADPGMYRKLIATILTNDVDYVKCDFDMFVDLPAQRLFYRHSPISENQRRYYNKVLFSNKLSELVRRDIYIWNGVYKRKFIKTYNIRFQETMGAAFQDAGFVSQVLMLAERVFYLPDSYYRYRKANAAASSSGTKTYAFVADEFIYTAQKIEIYGAHRLLPAFLRRYFGAFHHCLRQSLYMDGYHSDILERTKLFRELFKMYYQRLNFPALTKSDLWPPQDLAYFLNDFKLYCDMLAIRYQSDIEANHLAVGYFCKQVNIFICGIGDSSACVYCYLMRSGLNNILGFVSDDFIGNFYDRKVYSIAEAAVHQGIYLITRSVKDRNALANHFCDYGVSDDRIIFYGDGIYHHNWHELPTN